MQVTRITLVPHTHWDREWYGPFDEFQERLVAMMDTLIEAGERGFPHFHLDGQTAMIDDYLARRPEREPQIRHLASLGKLSVGPWVTQMDEFLVSGESHIRNLEMGMARARELGTPLAVGYLPDQFGHIGQMPQILRAGGLDRAVVWRGVPAAIERDAFVWESPDGSSVVAEYMAFGYFNGARFDAIEDPAELAAAITDTVQRQRPFLSADRMLVMVGYDHAGPDTTFPQRLDAARPMLDGLDAEIGGIARHLQGEKTIDLPRWRGELRSGARAHLLPNVYSSRVHQKRERGRVEALLERYAEPLAALVPGADWPHEELERAWTLLLWNGAHDSACGCSHDRVAIDVDGRFAEARAIGERIVARSLQRLAAGMEQEGTLRWNPSPFEREGVPGLGWSVDLDPRPPAHAAVDLREGRDGAFTADGVELTVLDEPDVGDLYTFCDEREDQAAWAPAEVHVDGATVRLWFDDDLEVEIEISRREGEPFLRLAGSIRNGRPDHRLRLHLRGAIPAEGSIAGSPFELVERPVAGEGGDGEAPSRTWPARGVAMAAEVALLHEGVFEYEVVEGSGLAVTLLRCVGTISREHLATRPFAAGPDVPTPDAQMIGTTSFSLGVWQGAEPAGLLTNLERFALPLASVAAPGGGSLPATGTLLEIDGDAQLSNVRRREGRREARLWNANLDRAVTVRVAQDRLELGPARIETVPLEG